MNARSDAPAAGVLASALKKDAAPDGWVEIGRVGKPHGVAGALYLRLHNRDSALVEEGLKVGLLLGDNWIEREVTHVGGGGAVTLDAVKGRDAADTLKHAVVYVHRDDFPPLDDDEVYLADLEGTEVLTPEGDRLGVVESFDDNGAQPLMQVRTENHRLVDVPFVGAFIVEIDSERIVLDAPEGLFDDANAVIAGDAPPQGPKSPRGRAKARRQQVEAAQKTDEDTPS